MRISTVTMYEQSLNALNRQQSAVLKVGQQIASGSRVGNPSDDPQAATLAVGIDQAKALDEQYADARVSARNSLSQEESALNSSTDFIVRARSLLVQAGNATLSDADRRSISQELQGIYQGLVGQANTVDGNGRYLFGGYQDGSPPFVMGADGRVSYVGDNGGKTQQVDSARWMPSNDNGRSIFLAVQNGAGFVASAGRGDGSANQGSLTFSGPAVVDSGAEGFGTGFTLSFASDNGQTVYRIGDGAAQPYQAGQSITYNGLKVSLDGQPADGDRLQVGRAEQGNTDLFATLKGAIDALATPTGSAEAKTGLQNTLLSAGRELDNSLENVLAVRASVGTRLNELDTLDTVGSNRTLNYEQILSDSLDLDYNSAISEYSLRQVGLQAAQKTFVEVQKLSLFDKI